MNLKSDKGINLIINVEGKLREIYLIGIVGSRVHTQNFLETLTCFRTLCRKVEAILHKIRYFVAKQRTFM